jgi:hypothetical protein
MAPPLKTLIGGDITPFYIVMAGLVPAISMRNAQCP